MISFELNGVAHSYEGDPSRSLLEYLRLDQRNTTLKDGCSGQAACGACGFGPLQQQRYKRDEVALNQANFCFDNGERLTGRRSRPGCR